MSTQTSSHARGLVDILILGAGWTSTFLLPLCEERGLSVSATTRDGRTLPDGEKSVEWAFDPEWEYRDVSVDVDVDGTGDRTDEEKEKRVAYERLPDARTVLVTFPIKQEGASGRLVRSYVRSRSQQPGFQPLCNSKDHPPRVDGGQGRAVLFVQLGSTGIWDGGPTLRSTTTATPNAAASHIAKTSSAWRDRHSPFDTTNARAKAEEELLVLSSCIFPTSVRSSEEYQVFTTVLDLCGLWGGARSIRNWVGRVGATKDMVRSKAHIHMIHGSDVARAILGVHATHLNSSSSSTNPPIASQRWMLTDLHSHDYWDVFLTFGSEAQKAWVRELMREEGVRGLPRSVESLVSAGGRGLDSREFWEVVGLGPEKVRLE